MSVVLGFVAPSRPQLLLAAERNEGWQRLHDSFADARQQLTDSGAEQLLIYSTQWHSIIGHQMQADPNPRWSKVDDDFHDLGTINYDLKVDSEFAERYCEAAKRRGLAARTVNYHGFPVDTGSLVVAQLLNPENRIPIGIVSCNVYADRGETLVLGKAARDAIEASGKKVAVAASTSLSNRMYTEAIDPQNDKIYSQKDDEWNRKLLELLEEGRLEDVSQLARQFATEAHGEQRMKAMWWLAAVMGETNNYSGKLFGYEAVYGTGQALLSLCPQHSSSQLFEYDEDSSETYQGDRNILSK
ncbi:MAG: hypothetical protein CMJ93_01365 [Planctomycetes bacterium]|nr:hypothetical protein [Planctomycetota bacterium]